MREILKEIPELILGHKVNGVCQMIYPEVSLEVWTKKYPALKDPIKCICGHLREVVRPWISKDYVGVETGICEKCGRPPASKVNYRNLEQGWEMMRRYL